MKLLSALCAVLAVLAFISMQAGNPTAINGVVGASLGCIVFAAVAWIERRHG